MGPRRANLRLRRTLSALAHPSHAAQEGDAEADESEAAGVGAAGQHPTDAERFKFGNEGFLVLPSLLPPTMVGRLLRALDDTVERRRQPGYEWPGRAERLGGGGDLLELDGNRHVDTLLHEDPVFLELMTYPLVMDYVRGLFNPDGTPPALFLHVHMLTCWANREKGKVKVNQSISTTMGELISSVCPCSG